MASKPNVLVIDDDRSVRESLRFVLGDSYSVVPADSGARALEVLRSQPIDLVTLEPRLRGLQGRELLCELRRHGPGVPILLVTAHKLSLWFDDSVRDEIFDLIPKPFDNQQLLRSARKAVVRRSLANMVCL